VHNVKPEAYIHEDQEKEVESIYKDLLSATSLQEFLEKIPENIGSSENISKVDPYAIYITENEDIFFNNPSAETKREYDNTLRHLAQAIVDANRNSSVSILVGNIVDEISRNFFGSDVLYNST